MLAPESVALVRDSFARLGPNGHEAAALFFGRLFSTAPETQALFDGIALFRQSRKLWAMLGVIVDLLDQPEHLMPAARALGRTHAGYGVEPQHFAWVGEALLWTLQRACGADWNDDLHIAWAEAFDALSDVMIDAIRAAGSEDAA